MARQKITAESLDALLAYDEEEQSQELSVGPYTSLKGLEIDFETYCELDVRLVGAYKYASHPSCEVLTMSYSLDGGHTVKRWVPWKDGYELPEEVQEYIEGNGYIIAHNSQFEMCVWEFVLHRQHKLRAIEPSRWRCTAAMCAAAGLPRSLEKAAEALKLSIKKDKEGGRLIQFFCKPRKPTKTNPSTRNLPQNFPIEFERLCRYCDTDVRVEAQIATHVPSLSDSEWRTFLLDIKINARGIPLDYRAVQNAFEMLQKLEREVAAEVTEITGGIRPTQRDKMLEYFNSLGLEMENVQAKTIKDLLALEGHMLDEKAKRLLMLRIEGGKASTKKLKKMLQVICGDLRVHGAFLYYGAHTGRWAGKLIQPQNFTRGEFEPIGLATLFRMIYRKDLDALRFFFEWPIDAMAQGMRGYIYAPKGRKFVVCDFSAIEARVLAWLAREEKVLDLYRKGADLYKRLAVVLYKLKSEDEVTTAQRKFAKDLFLGAGYQLGATGFINQCAQRGIFVSPKEAKDAIETYRNESKNIVQLWYDVEEAAIEAVQTCATRTKPVKLRNLSFFVDDLWFCIRLPSGRVLRYAYPKVERAMRFGRPVLKLTYRAEYKGKWVREGTYGGKLVENIVQAIARDLMVHACFEAEKAGYEAIGTVHDELITEVDEGFGSAEELNEIMRKLPIWATDAPVNAEGWEDRRYRK